MFWKKHKVTKNSICTVKLHHMKLAFLLILLYLFSFSSFENLKNPEFLILFLHFQPMENDPTVDQDTATVVRQITAEVESLSRRITIPPFQVKQGKPIKIIHNEVDVNLMNKLFSGKRFMSVTPRNVEPVHQAKKKKSELEEEKIDKTLMNMLFREEKKGKSTQLRIEQGKSLWEVK